MKCNTIERLNDCLIFKVDFFYPPNGGNDGGGLKTKKEIIIVKAENLKLCTLSLRRHRTGAASNLFAIESSCSTSMSMSMSKNHPMIHYCCYCYSKYHYERKKKQNRSNISQNQSTIVYVDIGTLRVSCCGRDDDDIDSLLVICVVVGRFVVVDIAPLRNSEN